ncbi:hypothetical protein H6F86_05230 [Phormidium sp. FACHB-592]|uniref:Nuclease A inhibitor family protein n=1 Tax=Stenomitos frigidus AS-A4 TaxID=2933935 RepID=A0ABV0KLC9_9CYAN|nr:nuclease A inhibitor family protein [Phormidium sp. FACHB-592]MBD2073298.1 hypothetical protein [Phormidium sp. FACHB-592]
MQDDTAQLIALIDSSIQGLLFRTEADYALKPFVWDVGMQGEFNISRLLQATVNLVAVEPNDFLSWREYLEDFERWEEFLEQNPEYLTHQEMHYGADVDIPIWMTTPIEQRQDSVRQRAEQYEVAQAKTAIMEQRYQTLLEVLQAHATNLQVYRVVKYDEGEYNDHYSNDRRSSKYVFESFKILVARVNDDCWIGISPIRSYVEFPTRPTLEKFLAQRIKLNQAETQELGAKLKPILDGITFIGRQCYDGFDEENHYACEFAATEDAVIDRLLHLSHFLNTWEFEGMSLGGEGLEGVYDYVEGDEDAEGHYVLEYPEEEGKFDSIDQLLRSHLKSLRIHIVGSISIFDIYAVGQAQNGDWLGVSTTAVWT